jgi:hypothetical protein
VRREGEYAGSSRRERRVAGLDLEQTERPASALRERGRSVGQDQARAADTEGNEAHTLVLLAREHWYGMILVRYCQLGALLLPAAGHWAALRCG